MSAREEICKESEYPNESHHWELMGQDNPHGSCRLHDYKCFFCGARKWIAIDPSEPFNQAVYWEADE